jgi:hypothetical protein
MGSERERHRFKKGVAALAGGNRAAVLASNLQVSPLPALAQGGTAMETAELIAYSKRLMAESHAIGEKHTTLCYEWQSLHETVCREKHDFRRWMQRMRVYPRHFRGLEDNGAG